MLTEDEIEARLSSLERIWRAASQPTLIEALAAAEAQLRSNGATYWQGYRCGGPSPERCLTLVGEVEWELAEQAERVH